MVVGRVVAVGRVGERKTILQQGQLGGSRWVHDAETDVGTKTKTFLIPHRQPGHAPQRLVGRKHPAFFERGLAKSVSRTPDHRKAIAVSDYFKTRLINHL
jgi:hypothetical protein